jgi:hypothetical protein
MADMTSLQPKSAPAAWYDENHDDADIERYHFLHDANFNVVAITNTSHDPITSNTVERYYYSPYGEVTHLGIIEADIVLLCLKVYAPFSLPQVHVSACCDCQGNKTLTIRVGNISYQSNSPFKLDGEVARIIGAYTR